MSTKIIKLLNKILLFTILAVILPSSLFTMNSAFAATPSDITAKDAETDGANGFTQLNGANGVDTFTIGGSTYAIVASYIDNGVQIIDISDPTNIVARDAETEGANGFTQLNGANGVDIFTIGGSTYAIVTSVNDDGVQIIDISDPTNIVARDAETDGANGFTQLNGAYGVDTFTIGGSTYAIVASINDDGVQIIDISDPTNIVARDAETDGANGFTQLDGANDVDTFTIGGSTYAIVASINDDGVQIILLNSETGTSPSATPNSDKCTVCIPPTIGLDQNGFRIVQNGFTLNQNPINVENFKQNNPTIFANTGNRNTVTLNINEEMGIQNIKYVALYLGLDSNDIYSNLAKIEWTNYNGIEKITITDKNNIFTNIFVNTTVIPPMTNSTYTFTPIIPNHETLNVEFEFSSNIPIPYSTIGVQVRDTTGNQMVNYFEDIIEITGQPLVPVSGTVLQDGTLESFITSHAHYNLDDYVHDFNGDVKSDVISPIDVTSTFDLPMLFTIDYFKFGFSDVLQNRVQLSQDKVVEQNKLTMMVNQNVAIQETIPEIISEKPRVEQHLLDKQNEIAQKKMKEILNLDKLARHNGTDIHNWND